MNGINQQLEEMIDLLQEISEKLSSIEGKLDTIETDISSVASNTDWLDISLDDIKNSIGAINLG